MANTPLNPVPTNTGNSAHNLGISVPRANMYNDPQGLRGSPVQSNVGLQQYESVFYTKKIIEPVLKKRKFSVFADTISIPKNVGMKVRAKIEIPVLDDRNLNDQGIDARGVQIRNGNFYGSSKDIGKIEGALPILTEEGGRVNRFGFSRTETEGTFNKFGIFFEYSNDLTMFDSDPQLVSRMYKQAIETASQITEDTLQVDLLNGAGTIVYAGNALSDETMNETSIITYQTLKQLSKALYQNQTPRRTKLITGSQNYDTKVVAQNYTLFVGMEVLSVLENLRDNWGEKAFTPIEKYAASTKVLEDEVGTIAGFRVVLVENMLGWYGKGANADPQYGLSSENGKYNIFPALVIGEDAFSCITFDGSNGVNNKFKIHHQKPEQSYGFHDPFGEVGFVSIKWWYGVLFKRPERIGIIKTVAPH